MLMRLSRFGEPFLFFESVDDALITFKNHRKRDCGCDYLRL
ncbi:MAG: hypothetical protein RLZZ360_887 [Candidatus Parcubacteria bacterium]|jgi:hypothetical protein